MDSLTFGWDWQGCNNEIISMLYQGQSMYPFPETTACTIDMIKNTSLRTSDPCCSETLQWTVCCQPRAVQTTRSFLALSPQNLTFGESTNDQNGQRTSSDTIPTNSTDFGKTSEDRDCVDSLLENYIFYDNLRHSITPCEGVITQSLESVVYNGLEFYRQCKTKFFGSEDGQGVPCSSTNDCHEIGSKFCDIFRGRCVFSSEEQALQRQFFFECLVEGMPISVRNDLSEQYFSGVNVSNLNNNATEVELVDYLETSFVNNDCNSDLGRSPEATQYAMTTIMGPIMCGPSDWLCFDPFCKLPLYLEAPEQFKRPGTFCAGTMARRSSVQSSCLSSFICNWNSSLTYNDKTPADQRQQITKLCQTPNSDNVSTTEYFCAVCSTPSNCIEIKGVTNQQDCENHQFCLNSKGELNMNFQEQFQCEQLWGSCSSDVCSTQDPSSCSDEQCNSTGTCSDEEILNRVTYLFNSFQPNSTPSPDSDPNYNGICVSPMDPWNDVDCNRKGALTSLDESPYSLKDFPLADVCVRLKNKTGCERWAHEGFRWIAKATNEQECLDQISACSELEIPSELETAKDEKQCGLCGSTYSPVFTWTKGDWNGAKLFSAQWKPRTLFRQYWWGEGVNFENISQTFEQSLSKQYAFQLITQAQCRLNPHRMVMERISCVSEKGYPECSSLSSTDDSVASAELCVNTTIKLVAPPSTILFGNEALVMSSVATRVIEGDQCLTVTVETVRQESVLQSTESLLSLSFRKQNSKRRNVWNDHSVGIGNTIGNGIQLNFDSTYESLIAEQICLFFPTQFSS